MSLHEIEDLLLDEDAACPGEEAYLAKRLSISRVTFRETRQLEPRGSALTVYLSAKLHADMTKRTRIPLTRRIWKQAGVNDQDRRHTILKQLKARSGSLYEIETRPGRPSVLHFK